MPPRWGFWFQWNERHRRVGPTHVCIPARRRRKTGDKDDDDAINDMQLRMAGGFGLLSEQGNLTLGSLTQRNATASNSRRHESKCKQVQVCQAVLDQADNESFWPRVVSYFRNIKVLLLGTLQGCLIARQYMVGYALPERTDSDPPWDLSSKRVMGISASHHLPPPPPAEVNKAPE